MDAIRYGVIGCAGIGPTHAAAVDSAEGAELVACSDINAAMADTLADEYGCAVYTDITEIIVDADIDAVSVCTPSGTHADVTVEAARAEAHVLCEKPLDVYADRINRMISVCEDEGVTLAGVFQKRTHESVQRAKQAVEDGELGDLILGDTHVKWFRSQSYYDSGGWRGTRDMDGGVLMNQAIHAIDRLQWLMGGVESVVGMTDTLARDLECEDAVAIALRFENGALGTVEATTAVKGGTDRTELNGTEGSITLSGQAIVDFQVGTGEESRYGAETKTREVEIESVEWGDPHAAVVQDFVDALREGREPMVSAREARKAVDVISATYESVKRGETVRLDEIRPD